MVKKNGLKGAINSLQIGKPFDLRSQDRVALRAPQVEVPHKENARCEQPQVGVPQRKDARIEPTQAEASQAESTTDEIAQNEVPRDEKPQVDLAQRESSRVSGFFKLAHSIFADGRLRELTGDAFRLFLWMSSQAWRFPSSDGHLRASIHQMSEGSGVSRATVSRCLRSLKAQRLVELVESDFKRGNLWMISEMARYGKSLGGAQIKGPRPAAADSSNRNRSRLEMSERLTQSEAPIIGSKNSNNFEKLPLRESGVEAYLRSLRPVAKRESEQKAYQRLLQEFNPRDVEEGFSWIQAHGIPGTGEPSHSPMAFLSFGIASVLQVSRAGRAAADARELSRRSQEDERAREDEAERKHAVEYAEWERAFLDRFPDVNRQAEALSHYSSQFPFLSPGSAHFRKLAISAWWNEQHPVTAGNPD